MQKVLIIQGYIPIYRRPIFDLLARCDDVEINVIHSGEPTAGPAYAYQETVVRCTNLPSAFFWQHGVMQACRRADVVVAMFDVRWLSTLAAFIRPRHAPFLWWTKGIGTSGLAQRMRATLAQHSDGVICYSDGGKASFLAAGVSSQKLFVAHNTIAVKELPSQQRTNLRKNFLFVGRLQKRRRLDQLLHAYASIKQHLSPETVIQIIGIGPETLSLRRLAQSLEIEDDVQFLGEIHDDDQLHEHFVDALVTVSPGTAGLGVLHSFAHGTGYVTCVDAESGGEIENIVSGLNGFVYDGSTEELASILLKVSMTPSLADELGRNARRHYDESCRPERMVREFVTAIHQATRGLNSEQ